ncbi:MAG: glycolate oxidase subunit GlcE [Betaproteobacteria bacterium]|nr:glycolate oxidase subunit GlcE [Betaproteobacteria bacterium]
MTLEAIRERVRAASERRSPLRLRGGGSKDFYGGEPHGEMLDLSRYAGIASYEPTELVVTARCGTPLAELESELAARGQYLPFEPPHFAPGATVGGCVAAGLSGPGRAAVGAVRDYVLGVKVIDGGGRLLAFGGQVMKNVAGYDVSRLFAGSLGTLGVIAEVSLKVLPAPQAEMSLSLEMPLERALDACNRWAALPLPVSASAWHDGELVVRLRGSEAGVQSAARKIGGAPRDASAFWTSVRDQTHPFFASPGSLWRASLPPTAAPLGLPCTELVEWGGALRWVKGDVDSKLVREAARRSGGHATLFRGVERGDGAFAPLSPVVMRLHRALKSAFDPHGIFNPGRLYPGL